MAEYYQQAQGVQPLLSTQTQRSQANLLGLPGSSSAQGLPGQLTTARWQAPVAQGLYQLDFPPSLPQPPPTIPILPRQHLQMSLPISQEENYDFVDKPNSEFFCPVSSKILLEPLQTECCGNHISQAVGDKLRNGMQPCPLCKHDRPVTHKDLFFQRKVMELKVFCPYKKEGCVWKGELRDNGIHKKDCPKSPWKCEYCSYEARLESKEGHYSDCSKYPLPCPNKCETLNISRCEVEKHRLVCPQQVVDCVFVSSGCTSKVPRCDVEKHLFICPLQPVDCSLAPAGCTAKVPRRDLADHLVANHIMNATLLNLLEYRQIVSRTTREIQYATRGFSSHELTLSQDQRKSRLFYNFPGEYCFSFEVDERTDSSWQEKRFHPNLYIECGSNDESLTWPIQCQVHLYLLNQRGDHEHRLLMVTLEYRKPWRAWYEYIGEREQCYPMAELVYNQEKNTEYYVDGCLKYQLYLKILPT